MLNTDIILMVGLPASGKSLITNDYLKLGYTILSLDKKTMSTATETATLDREMKKGNKVVIDNTNTTILTRSKFIDFAKKNNFTFLQWLRILIKLLN